MTLSKLANRHEPRVHYTLNGGQPVACTIIGRYPRFYMGKQNPHHGYAFCEACRCIKSYHREEDYEPIAEEHIKKFTHLVCNTCDTQIATLYGPMDE